ncbi:paraquat-inducible protein A [Aliikangiella coralliicola]|uniref:Paraquat-inducible protein A n=1 Tax=Aliikangiella coralliicola TaxID=2592383 RepID=A0A545UE85_9GAMM|nr:paraquat-inducible protein A [Aliikangiella coralliicola]TQV87790.1 hypothetical protein FLL46_10410 [Aliikangiella coralliicola]
MAVDESLSHHSGKHPGAQQIIACHECDLLVSLPPLSVGHKASCPRCGYVLTRNFRDTKRKILAFSLTSLIFLIFSLPFPFLSFSAKGTERVLTLLESIQSVVSADYSSVAVLIFLTTVLIPGVFLLGVIYIFISLKSRVPLPYTQPILKFIFALLPWNMAEIFLVGILVSFIKIASLAKVALGPSFIFYTLFIVSLALTVTFLDRLQVWQWVRDGERKAMNENRNNGEQTNE